MGGGFGFLQEKWGGNLYRKWVGRGSKNERDSLVPNLRELFPGITLRIESLPREEIEGGIDAVALKNRKNVKVISDKNRA